MTLKTFRKVLQIYPEIYSFSASRKADMDNFMELRVTTFQEGEASFYFAATIKDDWETVVQLFPLVTELHLDYPYHFLLPMLADAGKLEKVEKLSVKDENYAVLKRIELLEQEDKMVCLRGLPALRELELTNMREILIEEALPALETLKVHGCIRLYLHDILAKLNPEKLVRISIYNVSNLYFTPPKRKNSLPTWDENLHFEAIEKFTQLKHITFCQLKIRKLPFSLLRFSQLAHLNIGQNPLQQYPLEWVELPHLQDIDITDTPILYKKIIRSHEDITKLLKYFWENKLSTADRYALIYVLFEVIEKTNLLSFDDLLHLLRVAKYRFLKEKILVLCEKILPAPTLTADVQKIGLVGEFPIISVSELNDFFEAYGVEILPKTTQTSVICIGLNPKEAQIDALIRRRNTQENIVWCFPTQVKELMNRLEKPYLQNENDETLADNLHTLFNSSDKANTLLACQMMQNGGFPPLFFEYLCIRLCHYNRLPQTRPIVALMKKHATSPQIAVIEKMRRITSSRTALLLLFQSNEFVLENFIKAIARFFEAKERPYLLGILWKTEGETFEKVVAYFLQDGHLSFFPEEIQVPRIPKKLAYNPFIKTLALDWTVIQHNTNRDVVRTLPNLQKITVHLKDSIPQTTHLVSEYTTFYQKEFPSVEIVLIAKDNETTTKT